MAVIAGFDDRAFCGDRWAEVYDERHAGLDPAAAVEFLARLSGGRAARFPVPRRVDGRGLYFPSRAAGVSAEARARSSACMVIVEVLVLRRFRRRSGRSRMLRFHVPGTMDSSAVAPQPRARPTAGPMGGPPDDLVI